MASPSASPAAPPAPSSPSKRKHVANGAAHAHAQTHTYALQPVLNDILDVLKSYDTEPSILAHPITSTTRTSSGEANSKRAKLASSTAPVTIAKLIQDGSYDSLHALDKDVEIATDEILASTTATDTTAATPSLDETRLQTKALAFRKILKNLVDREEARKAHVESEGALANGTSQSPKAEDTPVDIKEEEDAPEPQSRTVLTLFGNAQGPKQLFSSLQQPYTIPPSQATKTLDSSVKVTLPLREATLPHNISTTEVFPLADQVDDKNKKITTIGDVFRAPAQLPQISPPKIAKPTTGKGNTITFAHPEPSKPRRKGSESYAHQNLSAGFWLGYGGVDTPKDQISPTARQKSRQRALSTGEAQQPPSEAVLFAVQQAKEDALFRSAYSSFAPTRDDSTAIVPEETKNRLWWQKVGEKRFNETFPIDPELLNPLEANETGANGSTTEDADFKEAVDNFVPIEGDLFPESAEDSEHDKDAEEVLREVSELIETLASHQRIRNSSLTTNPRTPVVQNSSLASLAGSPSSPSSEEIDVYQILKSQLTLMISQLPPYVVAKLNGDQLEELNISRTILFDTKEYKGVLEEDPLARLAKAPAMPVATPATLTRASSGPQTLYPAGSNQYARPSSSARPSQGAQSYQAQPSMHRSSSIQFQRSPSGPAQGYQGGAGSYASASRQGYPSTPGHNLQTPRPGPAGQYYQQRSSQPSSYGGPANSQFYQQTPQAQSQNRYTSQQGQNGYYQRSTNVAPMYSAAQTPQGRTASPLKGTPAATPSGYGARPGYGTPGAGQMASTYYGPSQYGTPQASTARTSYSGLSHNPQQMMIDRQQAQVAAQSQARLAAQNSFNSRQGSGTPQPPNGSHSVPT